MSATGIGVSVPRREDHRFITGKGQYTDDINRPGQGYAVFVRSPHAHATLGKIDTSAAIKAPGVLGVFTGADLAADKIGGLICGWMIHSKDGSPMKAGPHPALAQGKVRYVGDHVAVVIAETLAQARDAAELVAVDYDSLPASIDLGKTQGSGAPQLHAEAPGNTVYAWHLGDKAATDAAFAAAKHVTKIDLVNNRVMVSALEPRGAIGVHDAALDRYTLYSSTQGAHVVRDVLADDVFRIARERIRVITPDVGGGFGMKMPAYGEQALVLWAARLTGRPVRWVSDRQEAFTSDTQGRDQVSRAELALDADGRFLGLRVTTIANMGSYLSSFGPYVPTTASMPMLSGPYRIPAIHSVVKCVFTHTVPVDAYRGAGRPETTYLLERIIDAAAREIGLGPDEIRRRNFIPARAMPFTTILGPTYDSGDFDRVMTTALRNAGWQDIAARRKASRARGRRRGVGLALYVEKAGGIFENPAELRIETDGSATLSIGTQSTGQGHATTFAQIVSDGLGLPLEKIRFVQGDTDQIAYGSGTAAAASMPVGGHSVRMATDGMAAICRRWAATLLEAAEADIEFAEGAFRVVGTDRSLGLPAIAAAAYDPKRPADGLEFGLATRALYRPMAATFPNGCHVAEIEIDPDTGLTTICHYTIVDDFGRVLNPLLLEGQVQGGTAQGIGQAMFEQCRYDPETGQLLSGSFMDYRLPRAGDLPMFDFSTANTPCATNPMGVKGAGEAGALGAPPAIVNAIVDALAEFGVRHIDMPATPERVWRAIEEARET